MLEASSLKEHIERQHVVSVSQPRGVDEGGGGTSHIRDVLPLGVEDGKTPDDKLSGSIT